MYLRAGILWYTIFLLIFPLSSFLHYLQYIFIIQAPVANSAQNVLMAGAWMAIQEVENANVIHFGQVSIVFLFLFIDIFYAVFYIYCFNNNLGKLCNSRWKLYVIIIAPSVVIIAIVIVVIVKYRHSKREYKKVMLYYSQFFIIKFQKMTIIS